MSGTVTTSKAAEFEDALIAQLQARPGLAGVQVDIGPLGDDSEAEHIQSVQVDSEEEWGALGNRRKEELIALTLAVQGEAPGAGAEAIREARDRCHTLIAEVAAQLREDYTVNGTVIRAQITRSERRRGFKDRTVRREVWDVTVTANATLPRA